MALFNRKKEDTTAPAASGTELKPLTSEAFDFDAISRDLDAQGGASSFDSLLSQPATPARAATKETSSAFDFPENDPLGLSSPPSNPPERATTAVPTTPDTFINAPLVQPPTPSTGVAPLEPAPVEAPTGVTRLKTKKSMPLVPLLGALGLLAVVGGGAMFFLNSNKEAPETESAAPVVTRPRAAQNAATDQPATQTTAAAPAVPATGLRSASPGIAPPAVAITPAKGTSNVPISVGQSPARPATGTAPSATSGLNPAKASRLKELWKAGADAKHRNDFAGARKAWQQALQLAPNHPGFQDSINKLPR